MAFPKKKSYWCFIFMQNLATDWSKALWWAKENANTVEILAKYRGKSTFYFSIAFLSFLETKSRENSKFTYFEADLGKQYRAIAKTVYHSTSKYTKSYWLLRTSAIHSKRNRANFISHAFHQPMYWHNWRYIISNLTTISVWAFSELTIIA